MRLSFFFLIQLLSNFASHKENICCYCWNSNPVICLAACCLLSQHPFRVPPAFPPISLVYLSTMTYSWHSLEAFRNHSKFVKNEKTNFSAECILISCAPVEFFSFSSQEEKHRGECENQNVCACVCVCVLKRFAFHCNTPEMATLTNSSNNKNNRNRKMLLLPLGFPPLGNAGQIESTSTFLPLSPLLSSLQQMLACKHSFSPSFCSLACGLLCCCFFFCLL